MEAIKQNQPKATHSLIRLTREHAPPMGGDSPAPRIRRGTTGHLQEEVVVKRSTHAPASPKEAWRAILVKGQSISIEGQSTSSRPPSTHLAQLERPPLRQAPPRDRHTTSKGPNVATPTMSACPQGYQAKMEALCRPPIPRPIRPKADKAKGRDPPRRPNKKPGQTIRQLSPCHTTRPPEYFLEMPLLFHRTRHVLGPKSA